MSVRETFPGSGVFVGGFVMNKKSNKVKDNSNWIKCSDRLPEASSDNKKVLIYRIATESQISQSISILDIHMVKYCDQNETWWQPLPQPPNEGE